MSANKVKIWSVLAEEETPLGLVIAKTEDSAKKKFSKRTGKDLCEFHVQPIEFDKGLFVFMVSG